MGTDPTGADKLAVSDNIAQSERLSTTPDPRLPTPAKTPDSRLPTPAEPNWPRLYTFVLAELAIIIVLLYTFTKAFA